MFGDTVNVHCLGVSDKAALAALVACRGVKPSIFSSMNAATLALDRPGTMMPLDLEGFIRVIRINASALAYVAAMFEEHVAVRKKRGKVFIGSCSGSISDKVAGGH
jgi:hypothetical protein